MIKNDLNARFDLKCTLQDGTPDVRIVAFAADHTFTE